MLQVLFRVAPSILLFGGLLPAPLIAQAQAREARGHTPRLLWRFELPGQYVPVDPVMGPDETVYVMDLSGSLHALDPQGGELWTLSGIGPQGLDIGAEGTLYTGNDHGVTAVNSDGSLRWEYLLDSAALVSYGPSVGPDGNLFFVAGDLTPLGRVISLTEDGDLRWSTPVSIIPTLSFSQPVFGAAPDGGHQFIFAAGNMLARVDCDDGDLHAFADGSGARVVASSNGNIFHRGLGFDSAGNLLFMGQPQIQAASLDGTVYARMGNSVMRLRPNDGSVIWSFLDQTGGSPISPNRSDTRLLYGGPGNAYQPPGTVHYADTSGQRLWSLDLPVDDGRVSIVSTRAIFSADDSKAYFGSSTLFQGSTPNCYLYAIAVEP